MVLVFAAPHVTGTVALLQEFGDRQLRAKTQPSPADRIDRSNWSLDARRHEAKQGRVIKFRR